MAVEIELDDEEDIIRVYTRWPDQTWALTKLGAKDFARIMATHSGISLWRLKYSTREEAMAALNTQKLTGTAICKGKVLKDLGLRFFAKKPDDGHISARCVGCNLATNYPTLCEKLDGSDCGLKLESEKSLAKTLSNKRIFVIDHPITPPGPPGPQVVTPEPPRPPAPSAAAPPEAMAPRIRPAWPQPPAIAVPSRELSALEERDLHLRTLKELHFRQISEAAALERLLPILRKYMTDETALKWLTGEHAGFTDIEFENTFSTGMPPYIKTYRFVYADGVALRGPDGIDRPQKGWPQGEQRLQKIYWSLSDIDARLAERPGDFIYPPAGISFPGAPAGWEVRFVLHKSQLMRIKERFRIEFIKTAGLISELIEKEVKRGR